MFRLFFAINILSISVAASASTVSVPALKLSISQAKTHDAYLQYLRKFKNKHCTRNDVKEFNRLSTERKKLSLYVPSLNNGELDIQSIKKGLPHLERKWDWLIKVREKLKSNKAFPNRKSTLTLRKTLQDLLKLKEQYFLSHSRDKGLKDKSQKQLNLLRRQFESLMSELYFLQGFDYPVDHLQQRKLYADLSSKDPEKYTQQANEVMFLRRLQEDGTDLDDHSSPDVYLRTTLNTISVNLKKDAGPWIHENIRHDLDWALRRVDQLLGQGKASSLERIQNWINNLAGARKFYKNLLDTKNTHDEMQLFISKQEASWKLKEFVYSKTAQAYKDISEQEEYIQAYYVFDQILLGEAGRATVDNFRDREDIAQVIINSRFDPKLSVIGADEEFHKYLVAAGVPKKKMSEPSWLNAMFKSLRFSFTLYYIPAVQHVFCPDFYKVAQLTRKKNLYITWEALKKPDKDFMATRYFSRWSMLGRIEMDKVWDDFEPLPEKPGAQFNNIKNLTKKYKSNQYDYFYTFIDPKGEEYHVLEIGNRNYAMKLKDKTPEFYAYRDIHKFQFFKPK